MSKRDALLDRDGVRALLAEHLPWSPIDFVPAISRSGDRGILAEQLCRDLDAGDDLRFAAGGKGKGFLVFCERLPWDTAFFGYGVARISGIYAAEPPLVRPTADYRKPLRRLCKVARKRGVRYLFAVVDPRDLGVLRALGEEGFCLIETRWFHHGPIEEPVLKARTRVRRATLEDVPSLAKAARGTINPYDRFHADPAIDPSDATRLMEEWVARSVEGAMADLVVVPDVPEPGAFVTYRLHRDRWERWGCAVVQGVLSAVAPEFMGWMDRLGAEVAHHLYLEGARHAYGSTQVTNRSILWFGQESGARFGRCEHVFRRLLAD